MPRQRRAARHARGPANSVPRQRLTTRRQQVANNLVQLAQSTDIQNTDVNSRAPGTNPSGVNPVSNTNPSGVNPVSNAHGQDGSESLVSDSVHNAFQFNHANGAGLDTLANNYNIPTLSSHAYNNVYGPNPAYNATIASQQHPWYHPVFQPPTAGYFFQQPPNSVTAQRQQPPFNNAVQTNYENSTTSGVVQSTAEHGSSNMYGETVEQTPEMRTQANRLGEIPTSVQDSQDLNTDLSLLAKLGDLGNTPIDPSRLEIWLQDYDDIERSYLLAGFREGFRLEYAGPRHSLQSKNLKSAILNPDILLAKLEKEVELGRMLGPFTNKPFSNLRVNPVGLVPKSSGGMRLITHLSYPYGNSVNDYIDDKLSSVQYSKFDNVVNIVQNLGFGALMGKRDVKSAFNLCPVHPEDFNILGVKFENKYWIQKMLPQGCSISPAIFERFSTFLQWAVSRHSTSNNLDHYLDDFFFAGKADSNDCADLITIFEYICDDIKIPINHEKSVGPVTTLVYLGLEIDAIRMEIRVPDEKILKAKAQISEALLKRKITLSALQSILGSLNFFSKAIPTGRTFSCRLYQAQSQARLPHHFIRLTKELKEDLNTWLNFLDNFNGTSIMAEQNWITDEHINLYTDAAGNKLLGCGAYLSGEWFVFKWPASWNDDTFRDITLLELVPIMLAFLTWGYKLQGKKIVLHCDNLALVHIINNKSSRNKKVLILLRQLVLVLLMSNIQLKAVHIISKQNRICDAISRLQFQKVRQLLPAFACKTPLMIPLEFQLLISEKLAD